MLNPDTFSRDFSVKSTFDGFDKELETGWLSVKSIGGCDLIGKYCGNFVSFPLEDFLVLSFSNTVSKYYNKNRKISDAWLKVI